MITIDKALDSYMQLDFNSRELLLEVLQKRQIEERRKQIAINVKKAKQDFANGKLSKPMTAKECIESLNKFL